MIIARAKYIDTRKQFVQVREIQHKKKTMHYGYAKKKWNNEGFKEWKLKKQQAINV